MVFVRGGNKKGQVTLFIILAIVLVAGITLFFVFKNNLSSKNLLDKEVQPIYDSYLSCIKSYLENGVKQMAYQGGYLYLPEFVPGSLYRPTSSQLDFFGQPIPYWYYLSGNNLIKQQVPTINGMESQLERYLEERIYLCDFSEYNTQGYSTYSEEGEIRVTLKEDKVEVYSDNNFNIYTNEDTYVISSHEISLPSKLGKYYNLAKETFDYEMDSHFLESYSLDALWTSVPVTGLEFGCTPLSFSDEDIRENLTSSLSTNIASIKLKGNYYSLNEEVNKYFIVDLGKEVDENVNFMYSTSWPTRIDISGDRTIQPIGIQEGLEMLGFCYSPYHLVYSFEFPVLIQFFDEDMVFQFPVEVVIENNDLLNFSRSSKLLDLNDEICNNMNNKIRVYTYDSSLNPIESRLQYDCMGSVCEIGSTFIEGYDAYFEGAIPACVNGRIVASAEGYLTTDYVMEEPDDSTPVNIILPKFYELGLSLNTDLFSIVYIEGEDYSTSLTYPNQRDLNLVEGEYNISVLVYSNANILFSDVPNEICVDVPLEGVAGLTGATQKECYSLDSSLTEIEMALIGGGTTSYYFTESELATATNLYLDVPLFDRPQNIEDLQENYLLQETSSLEVNLQ